MSASPGVKGWMRFFERLRGRSDFREESKGLGYCSKKVDLADLDAPSLRSSLFWIVLKGSWKDTLDFRLLLETKRPAISCRPS